MKGCRPLNDAEIEALQGLIRRGRYGKRDLALVVLGIQTGLRISEILSLRRQDLMQPGSEIVGRVTIQRRHMKKKIEGRTILLHEATRTALAAWLLELGRLGYIAADDFVFQAQSGGNRHISRQRAWGIIHGAARSLGMTGTIGTHSMRKTFADKVYSYFLNKAAAGNPVDAFRTTSKALGHQSINSTDKYLSFREETIDEAIGAIFKRATA